MTTVLIEAAAKFNKVLTDDSMYNLVSIDELRTADNIDIYRDWLITLVEECEAVKDVIYDDAIPAF